MLPHSTFARILLSSGILGSVIVGAGFVSSIAPHTERAVVGPTTTVTATPSPSASNLASTPANGWPDSASASDLYPGGVWLNPASLPVTEVAKLRTAGASADADTLGQISSQPIATWLGDWWSSDLLTSKLTAMMSASAQAHDTPVFVIYAIPDRDCGGYSAGGYSDADYVAFNRTVADSLRGHPAVVLMEPDSIAMLGTARCGSIVDRRLGLISTVVQYYAQAGVAVYLDGGNSNWVQPQVMADRLTQAGVQYARGFFTNVSNFRRVSEEQPYAEKIVGLLGGTKHYVIDVSRNGAGWKGTWCNPTGAALGQNPSVSTAGGSLDALLWVKTPGASDGTCNGGPAAGKWYQSYALDLVRNRAALAN
ncbi:glycoside hydrolase family 6 protein [Lacisediminihabitans changchengi]|uniref:Glucanase n=1 Tax=Lacisediminihabitans changchengi TaxID=2787634 RepID=A0A934STU3_9MICO|nr:glycoside hydrolase family 6 protein [Lacisediminihabitans changchengi]MBK4346893.1 glycoside hydrolase family 6 protein [Lacisediminihabitans changchengi]MBK4347984.1 glycoside hydrolase family 6 protein [Lacisediminihabitans changchengi]